MRRGTCTASPQPMPHSSEQIDAVVLGAGASGLAAAARLTQRGLEVRVIEARARIGGRIATVPSGLGVPIELGAEFVHGSARATEEVGRDVAFIDLGTGSHWTRKGGAIRRSSEFESTLGMVFDRTSRRVKRGRDRSFLKALDECRIHGKARSLALSYIEGFQAADPAKISTRALGDGDLGSERSRRVAAGYETIPRLLAAQLPATVLLLGTRVTRIDWSRGRVTVLASSTQGGGATRSIRAKRLITTVPLSILAASIREPNSGQGITFDPPLDRKKQTAVAKLEMGNVVKVIVRFRTAFWADPRSTRVERPWELGFLHAHGSESTFPTWWTQYPIEVPMLTGWCGGPPADALDAMPDQEVTDHAVASISRIFGVSRAAAEENLVEVWRHSWRRDPFALGAYSYPSVGGEHAGRALAAPVDDTLFFAGEATVDPPDNGTVHGAIESGWRAADQILKLHGSRL